MASYNFTRPLVNKPIFEFDKLPYTEPTPALRKFYFHRAWNTVELLYETWTTEDNPDPSPPSGDPITGITIAAFWKKVV
jgi:hypothetical protein